MKKIHTLSIIILALLFSRCIKVKNHVKITGGHYRIVTYSYDPKDSIKTIYPANETDTLLGLAISFNVQFFSDGSQTAPLINTHVQGLKGPLDTIKMILIANKQKKLLSDLKNIPRDSLFIINVKNALLNKPYHLYPKRASNGKEIAYTYFFSDINDFIKKYNQRWSDLTKSNNLEREIFFWFSPESNIRYNDLKNLDFKIYFNDGRVVEITPYEEKD